jgi:shikimate kinase
MIVTLIGYRGSGKSSVAGPLAARLGYQSVDADEEVQRRAGCSIRQLFDDEGEPAFRRLERAVLADLLARDRLVVAAGGGAVLDEDTRRDMRRAGPVVWLRAGARCLERRINSDAATREQRPPLTASGGEWAEIQSLLAAREPLYRQTATLVVDTDSRTPEEVVELIAQRLSAGAAENTGP